MAAEAGRIFGPVPWLCVVAAKKASGKSELARFAAYKYRDKFSSIVVISATAEVTSGYTWLDDKHVHTGYDPAVLEGIIERQTAHKKAGREVHCLVILDDILACLPHNLSKYPELIRLATQNRHLHVSLIICSQHPRAIAPAWRQNLDRLCILRSLRPAYELLASEYSNFPTKRDFIEFLEEHTADFGIVMFNARESDPDKFYTVFRVPSEFMQFKFSLKCCSNCWCTPKKTESTTKPRSQPAFSLFD